MLGRLGHMLLSPYRYFPHFHITIECVEIIFQFTGALITHFISHIFKLTVSIPFEPFCKIYVLFSIHNKINYTRIFYNFVSVLHPCKRLPHPLFPFHFKIKHSSILEQFNQTESGTKWSFEPDRGKPDLD